MKTKDKVWWIGIILIFCSVPIPMLTINVLSNWLWLIAWMLVYVPGAVLANIVYLILARREKKPKQYVTNLEEDEE